MSEQRNAPVVAGTTDRGEIRTNPQEKEMTDISISEITDTLEELKAGGREARRRFLLAHPEVEVARPSWAEITSVDAVDGDEADLIYSRSFGRLELTASAVFEDGVVVFDEAEGRPRVYFDWERYSREGMTVADMRELASELLAAIPLMEAAEVTL